MRLPTLNDVSPISKIRDARKEEVSSASEEVSREGEHEEVAGCGTVVALTQQVPKQRRENKIDERAISRDPPSSDVRLQLHGAQGHDVCAAEQGGYAMSEPFVEDIYKNVRKCGDRDYRYDVIVRMGLVVTHGISYTMQLVK